MPQPSVGESFPAFRLSGLEILGRRIHFPEMSDESVEHEAREAERRALQSKRAHVVLWLCVGLGFVVALSLLPIW